MDIYFGGLQWKSVWFIECWRKQS